MRKLNRRAVPRTPVVWDALCEKGTSQSTCWLMDLSTAGACMVFPVLYDPNIRLYIKIDLSILVPGTVLRLEAMVAWSKETDGQFLHGLFFTHIDDDDLKKLSHALDKMEAAEAVQA